MDSLKNITGLVTAITALVAGLLGILRYFQYKTRRDKIVQVREAFASVVKSLSSEVEVERMAGAILLRRFLDRKTEVGVAGIPYWREAINVAAAILRGQATGNFQKLLADGLAFAHSLERADLQKTNLQFAYLGERKIGSVKKSRVASLGPWLKRENAEGTVTTDLSYADLYRADLSMASLKKAKARGAVFYQARMHNTVLTGADLRDANFFEADLKGARFGGARLAGAKFECARNVPPALASKLDDKGVYKDEAAFELPPSTSGSSPIRVFISKPGYLSYQQQQYMASVLTKLESEGITLQTLERPDYPNFGVFAEVQRLMSDCAGTVIFGFKQLEVRDGVWRLGTPEEEEVKAKWYSTPWNQIEAGWAVMLGLPMLVICERGVAGGIFDAPSGEHQVHKALIEEGWNAPAFLNSFTEWCADVREKGRYLASG